MLHFNLLPLLLISNLAMTQDWPGNDESLLFLFQNANEEIFAFLPGSDDPLFDYALNKEGYAQINSVGALKTRAGQIRCTQSRQKRFAPQ